MDGGFFLPKLFGSINTALEKTTNARGVLPRFQEGVPNGN
jgi:hypothetical protein